MGAWLLKNISVAGNGDVFVTVGMRSMYMAVI